MLYRLLILLPLLGSAGAAFAGDVTDSTGRVVTLPDQIARVLPAGPPAAILMEAIAPDLMIGWPAPVSARARGLMAPSASKLPQVPRLTGREDVMDKIKALKPDLILDYGGVTRRYFELAQAIQAKTGIPTLLFNGSLDEIPRVVRTLGAILHREGRAETLAVFAEALLTLPAAGNTHPRVVYARGADGLTVAAPGTDVTEVFTRLGWTVLAPEDPKGEHTTFRPSSIDAIKTLDPDVLIFSNPAMRETLPHDQAWRVVRAVREGHAMVAPASPFGWVEEPPSLNRLIGLAWLGGHEPASLAATFNAVIYGHALAPAELDTALAGVRSFQP